MGKHSSIQFGMAELSPSRQQKLSTFIQQLGLPVTPEAIDWTLLDLALTHPSLESDRNNDRLEFLGDAILRLLVGDFLYSTYPQLAVGQLALLRSDLLSNTFFAGLADGYNFDTVLRLGGSASKDVKGRTKRHADAFEAVVGALYLSLRSPDSAQVAVTPLQAWLEPALTERVKVVLDNLERHNAKTTLQELTQQRWGELPTYRVVQQPQGKRQQQQFLAEVWVGNTCQGMGKGRSKKIAETEAALAALDKLQV
ncbi:MAG: ribonuclease III [Cyanobacteria bacterium P01_A01_bin.3]